MNPSDILYVSPSINVGGVILYNKLSQDTLGNISMLFPPNIGVTSNDSTLGALIKTANSSGGGSSSGSVAGSFISTGSDNKLVAQVIQDVSFFTSLTNYTGGLCKQFNSIVTNIFNYNDINTNNILQFQTNYFLKHVGATITLFFIDTDGNTYSDSHILTNSSNIGVYNSLTILNDGDPFLNNLPYANIFTACKYSNTFRNFSTNTTYTPDSTLTPYIYILKEQYSLGYPTYNSYALPFYVDSSPLPSMNINIGSYTSAILTSGLYILPLNSTINFTFTVNNITSQFYNPKVINIDATFTTTTYISATQNMINSCYNTGSYTFNYSLSVNKITSGIQILTLTVNSLTKSSSSTLQCLIDTTTNLESNIRVTSGTGRFTDTSNFNTYNSSVPLTNNEELLYLFGKISYPSTNYTNYIPQGLDYSNLTGSFYTYRWFTQKINQSNILPYISNGYIQINLSVVNLIQPLNNVIIDLYMNNNIYIVSSPYNETSNIVISDCLNNKIQSSAYLVYFDFKSQVQVNTDIYIRLGIPSSLKGKITFSSLTLCQI
jgi:hypothetical protein